MVFWAISVQDVVCVWDIHKSKDELLHYEGYTPVSGLMLPTFG